MVPTPSPVRHGTAYWSCPQEDLPALQELWLANISI